MKRYGRYELSSGERVHVEIEGQRLHVLDRAIWLGGTPNGRVLSREEGRALCPVEPSKILCIGRNYQAHAKEMGAELPSKPLLFLKPPSSLLDPNGTVQLPAESERVEHEVELGVVIGTRCRRITVEEALDVVLGYTIVGDITARDLQKTDGQWSRAKGFDTFCPVGPEIVSGLDARELAVRALVNGHVRQDGSTHDMIFSVAELVSYLSQAMTLEAGDLIATGTPEGVGPLVHGDRLEMQISEIGALSVSVESVHGR